MLYQNAATLCGLIVWYGVLVLLGSPGRGLWRWLWPLLPLAAGGFSFRAVGWYLAAVHPTLTAVLQPLSGGRTLLLFIQDVGLREELIKVLFALPCMLCLSTRLADTRIALLAAAYVGLGFATAENRWFFAGHAEPTPLVERVFSTTALHMAGTALCGAALLPPAGSRHIEWPRFFIVFPCIVVAHDFYDWAPMSTWTWLRVGGTSWLSQAVVIILMAAFFHDWRRLQPAAFPPPRATFVWFLLGAAMQYALALGLTWMRWGTPEAAWICGRECLLFLPSVAATAALLIRNRLSQYQHH